MNHLRRKREDEGDNEMKSKRIKPRWFQPELPGNQNELGLEERMGGKDGREG